MRKIGDLLRFRKRCEVEKEEVEEKPLRVLADRAYRQSECDEDYRINMLYSGVHRAIAEDFENKFLKRPDAVERIDFESWEEGRERASFELTCDNFLFKGEVRRNVSTSLFWAIDYKLIRDGEEDAWVKDAVALGKILFEDA